VALIITLVVTGLLTWLLSRQIQKAAWMFYALAAVVAIVGTYLILTPQPSPLLRGFAIIIQRGHVAFSLFVLVMYTGAFEENSLVRRVFEPVRAQISIVASILICGHLMPYVHNFLMGAVNLQHLKLSVLGSLALALVLLVLLLMLVVTSFAFVRRRMSGDTWRKIQRLAYPFFGLIYLHQLGYLLVPALKGSPTAWLSIVVYTLVFAAYLVLRLHREVAQSKARERRGQVHEIR